MEADFGIYYVNLLRGEKFIIKKYENRLVCGFQFRIHYYTKPIEITYYYCFNYNALLHLIKT